MMATLRPKYITVVYWNDNDRSEIDGGDDPKLLRKDFKEWARSVLPLDELRQYHRVAIERHVQYGKNELVYEVPLLQIVSSKTNAQEHGQMDPATIENKSYF